MRCLCLLVTVQLFNDASSAPHHCRRRCCPYHLKHYQKPLYCGRPAAAAAVAAAATATAHQHTRNPRHDIYQYYKNSSDHYRLSLSVSSAGIYIASTFIIIVSTISIAPFTLILILLVCCGCDDAGFSQDLKP